MSSLVNYFKSVKVRVSYLDWIRIIIKDKEWVFVLSRSTLAAVILIVPWPHPRSIKKSRSVSWKKYTNLGAPASNQNQLQTDIICVFTWFLLAYLWFFVSLLSEIFFPCLTHLSLHILLTISEQIRQPSRNFVFRRTKYFVFSKKWSNSLSECIVSRHVS